ncbi:HmuY family protein [Prevotella fusca]
MRKVFNPISMLAGFTVMLMVTACNGVFDGIYDEVPATPSITEGQLLVDATSWKDWCYVDFDSLHAYVERKDTAGLLKAQTRFVRCGIPTSLSSGTGDGQTGIYTYWFDVFGKGISVNEKRSFAPADVQPEPQSWSLAFHRNNVRTNNGAVLETNYTSMNDLPKNSAAFLGAVFQTDEWTENEVWVDRSQMLQSLIGCQGIMLNKVLSSWLKLEIPPMPPAFTHKSHVFIVRLSNGKYVAVQLENYIGADGTKCWLKINYKYPY